MTIEAFPIQTRQTTATGDALMTAASASAARQVLNVDPAGSATVDNASVNTAISTNPAATRTVLGANVAAIPNTLVLRDNQGGLSTAGSNLDIDKTVYVENTATWDYASDNARALHRTELGLGTAATINTGATGAELMVAATPAAARAVLGATTSGTASTLVLRGDEGQGTFAASGEFTSALTATNTEDGIGASISSNSGQHLNVGNNKLIVSNAGLIQLGGQTASFPALKRNGTGIEVRLADDSGLGDITALNLGTAASVYTGATGEALMVAETPAAAQTTLGLDAWLSARTARYDIEQNLSQLQRVQAQRNLGIYSPFFNRFQAAEGTPLERTLKLPAVSNYNIVIQLKQLTDTFSLTEEILLAVNGTFGEFAVSEGVTGELSLTWERNANTSIGAVIYTSSNELGAIVIIECFATDEIQIAALNDDLVGVELLDFEITIFDNTPFS